MRLNLIVKRAVSLILLVLYSEIFLMIQSQGKYDVLTVGLFIVACIATYLVINKPVRGVDMRSVFGERAEYMERVLREYNDKVNGLCPAPIDRNAPTDNRSPDARTERLVHLQSARRVSTCETEAAD